MMAGIAGRPIIGREAGVGGTGRAALAFGRRLAARRRDFRQRDFRGPGTRLGTRALAGGQHTREWPGTRFGARFGEPNAVDRVFRSAGLSRAFYARFVRMTLSLSLSTLAQHLMVWRVEAPLARFVLRSEERGLAGGGTPARPSVAGVWLRTGMGHVVPMAGPPSLDATGVRSRTEMPAARGTPPGGVAVPIHVSGPLRVPWVSPPQGSMAGDLLAFVRLGGRAVRTEAAAAWPAVARAEAAAATLAARGPAQAAPPSLTSLPAGPALAFISLQTRSLVGQMEDTRWLAPVPAAPAAPAAATRASAPAAPRFVRPAGSAAHPAETFVPVFRWPTLAPAEERRGWGAPPVPRDWAAAAERATAGLGREPFERPGRSPGATPPLPLNAGLATAALAGDEVSPDGGTASAHANFPLVRLMGEQVLEVPAAAYVYAAPPAPPMADQRVIQQVQEREVVELVRHEVEQAMRREPIVAHLSRSDYAEIADLAFSTMIRRIEAERERRGW